MSLGKLPAQQPPKVLHERWPVLGSAGAATGEPRHARVSYLRPGSIVVHSFCGDSAADSLLIATDPEADIEVAGRIRRIEAGHARLLVGRQTVQLDALSHAFRIGADGRRVVVPVRELAVGDRVEIAGPRNSRGEVLATRIERLDRIAAG